MAVGAYVVLAGCLVYLARYQMNPDAVSYIQSARHYARGRFDLAVNSWFAPLLSWLLVPAARLGGSASLTAKVLGVAFGLGFAAGTVDLARRFGARRGGFLTFVCALGLALTMVPHPITPDVMFACLMTWYFVLSAGLIFRASAGRSFAAGALGGLCYLAKAYALPFVAVHLGLTFLARRALARRGQASGRVLGSFLMSLAGLLVVAGPWIGVISVHDGTATFSSASWGARAFGPHPLIPLPSERLQRPRPGRINVWENPIESAHPWACWSPLDGVEGLARQLDAIDRNAARALKLLKGADALGLLTCGWLAALILSLPIARKRVRPEGALRLWACASAVLFVGGYVLVFVEGRFLWPVCSVLLALTVSVLGLLEGPGSGNESGAPARSRPDAGRARRALHRGLAVALVVSIGYNVYGRFREWSRLYGRASEAAFLRNAARRLAFAGPAASEAWHQGLAVCYWKEEVFLGRFFGASPEDIAQELAPFGKVNVLVFWDDALAAALDASPWFRAIDVYEDPPTRWRAHLLEFRPPPQPSPGRASSP